MTDTRPQHDLPPHQRALRIPEPRRQAECPPLAATSPAVPVMTLMQAAFPDYRLEFLEELETRADLDVRIFSGDTQFQSSVASGVDTLTSRTRVKNIYLLNRKVLIQYGGGTRASLRADLAVVEMTPRILNSWLILVARKMLGRPTLAWGHAFPRQGAMAKFRGLRAVQRRLAGYVICYTEDERQRLTQLQPAIKVFVAPNAEARKHPPASSSPSKCNTLVYSGRLVSEKRPTLLLEAFKIFHRLHPDTQLVFMGDGPEAKKLKEQVAHLELDGAVSFEGHVREAARLSAIYERSFCSVSPGYAGLSLTQALSFGIPMLIADDEPHAPEISLADLTNSRFFTARNADSLAAELVELYTNKENWIKSRKHISEETQRIFSADAMANAFAEAAFSVLGLSGNRDRQSP